MRQSPSSQAGRFSSAPSTPLPPSGFVQSPPCCSGASRPATNRGRRASAAPCPDDRSLPVGARARQRRELWHSAGHDLEEAIKETSRSHALVRDDERTRKAEGSQILWKLGEDTPTEPDGREIGDQSHRCKIS